MADTIILLEGSYNATSVNPTFTFGSGTIEVELNDVNVGSCSTGVAGVDQGEGAEPLLLVENDKLEYICSDWDAITKIDMSGDDVRADDAWVLPTGLIELDLSNCTQLNISVTDWVLSASLTSIDFHSTSIEGSLAGWSLPAGLIHLDVGYSDVIGSVTTWVLPNTLTYFDIGGCTDVEGSVTDWVLPAGLVTLNLDNIAISGDISGWVLPNTLEYLKLSSCNNLSGDLSSWVLPDSLVSFYVNANGGYLGDVGGSGGWELPTSLVNFYIHGTLISGDVSAWDLSVTSLVNFYACGCNIGGDISLWEFPDTLTSFNVYQTSVEGDISNWIFPDSVKQVEIYDTSVEGDISGWDPNNIRTLKLYDTSVEGDISGWTFYASLDICHIYDTFLTYDSIGGPFADVTKDTPQFYFYNCGLTEQQIDNILADCVTGGADDGRLNLKGPGENPNSGPSVDGLDDVVILESEARGTWIVDYNSVEVLLSASADIVFSTTTDVHEEDVLSGSVDIVISTELNVHEEDNLSLFANLGLTGESDTEVEESEIDEVLVKGKGILGSPQITNSQIIGEGDLSDETCPQGQDCDNTCGLIDVPNEFHPGTKDLIINF